MLKEFGKKLLRFLIQSIFVLYEAETNLLFLLVSEAEAQGLKGDSARKYVQEKFRERYKEELRESLLNFLLESVVLSTKQ